MADEFQKVGSLVKEILQDKTLAQRYYQALIRTNWEKWMGPVIAKRTLDVRLYSTTLVISVNSAPLRKELVMSREQIIESLNKQLKTKYIKTVEIR